MPDFPNDVDVAIVAHNNLAILPATLTSLAAAGCPHDRITVVDVASTDGTGEWIAREWPTWPLLLDPQTAIEIGLFDARYFIGKEDGDFTHRIKMAGYKMIELPQALVLHNSRPRGSWLFYYQIRNRWHFILKNYQIGT